MTTEELIEILKRHPGKRVFVDGYEGGIQPLKTDGVVISGSEPSYAYDMEDRTWGTHDEVAPNSPDNTETVLLLSRESHDPSWSTAESP